MGKLWWSDVQEKFVPVMERCCWLVCVSETESKKEGKGDSKEADDVAEKLGELKVKDESSADKSAPAAKVNDEKTNDSPSGSDNGVER